MSELVDRAKASLEGVTGGPWETRPGATGDPTTTSASVHSGHRSVTATTTDMQTRRMPDSSPLQGSWFLNS